MTKETKLYAAILSVQSEAPIIGKGTDNPFFKSKYADLADIWKSIRELMKKNRLLISHTIECVEGVDYIRTKIIHADTGEFIESATRIPVFSKVQEYGSYITYIRRYSISAMLGLVTDEDDDGNAAVEAQKKQPPKPAEPKTSPELAKQREFLAKAKKEIEAITEYADIATWFHDNIKETAILTDDQVKWLNDTAGKHKKKLEKTQ